MAKIVQEEHASKGIEMRELRADVTWAGSPCCLLLIEQIVEAPTHVVHTWVLTQGEAAHG